MEMAIVYGPINDERKAMTNKIIMFFSTLALSAPAVAGQMYAGGSLGSSDYDIERFGKATGFSIRGGYQFTDYFAAEGGYTYGGEADDNDGDDSWYIKGGALQAAIKASTNISAPVYGYGKLGFGIWEFELDASSTGNGRETVDGTDLLYGVGVGWNFNESGRALLEYQNISIDNDDADGNVSTISVGVEFKF